jgi:uridylate kinase
MFDELTYMEVLAKGLKVMDSTAITMCKDHELPVVVFNISTHGNIVKAVQGERIGTLVH